MNGPLSTPQKRVFFENSSFDNFFENDEILKNSNSPPQNTPLWRAFLKETVFHDFLNPNTGFMSHSVLESLNWPFPQLEGFGTLNIGNYVINPVSHDAFFFPNLWNASLDEQVKKIQSLAHSLAKCTHRFVEVQFNSVKGTPYGAFTVHDPKGKSIALAPDPIQDSFNEKIAAINKAYIQKVNTEALDAFAKTYKFLCQSLIDLRQTIFNSRAEQMKEMLDKIPVSYAQKDMFENYWFCSSQLFGVFDYEFEKFSMRFKQHSIEIAAKRMAKEQLIQKAKDDLMDVELSRNTIDSLVTEKVKSLLEKGNPNVQGNEKPGKRPPSRPKQAKSPLKKKTPVKKEAKKSKTLVKGKAPTKAKAPLKTAPPKMMAKVGSKASTKKQ